tara:strand:- start:694 stop:987 length:294 start_codon:yes stop_codon:yes gene_type:complete
MAKKKKHINPLLNEEQEKQLQNMVNGMLDIAANVMEDYEDIDDMDLDELKALSGSLTQIHEDSPFLDELLKGDSWKRVIKNIPTVSNSKEDKKDDSK